MKLIIKRWRVAGINAHKIRKILVPLDSHMAEM